MSNQNKPVVSEDDLHAYVDGQLSTARSLEIKTYLKTNPKEAQMVASWAAQNDALRNMFQSESEKGDADLIAANTPATKIKWKWPLEAAAAVAIFTLGVISGPELISRFSPSANVAGYVQTLPEAARASYAIYASEVRHPVEVGADEETHLVTWLGKRLGANFVTPDLTKTGFRLVGGRLVPYAGKPGAMLMYEDATGERLTVLIGRQPGATETGFKFAKTGDVRTFYWMDGALGYALSGAIDRKSLKAVAYEVYHQI